MRLLMLIAVVLLAIAFVCVAVPTSLLSLGALGWFVLGMLVWAVDVLVGGYVVAAPTIRRA